MQTPLEKLEQARRIWDRRLAIYLSLLIKKVREKGQ